VISAKIFPEVEEARLFDAPLNGDRAHETPAQGTVTRGAVDGSILLLTLRFIQNHFVTEHPSDTCNLSVLKNLSNTMATRSCHHHSGHAQ